MKNPVLKVGDKYRTHPLSKTEGGVTVVVELKNGTSREYQNVKNSKAFIAGIYRNDTEQKVIKAYVKQE